MTIVECFLFLEVALYPANSKNKSVILVSSPIKSFSILDKKHPPKYIYKNKGMKFRIMIIILDLLLIYSKDHIVIIGEPK
tara:strand:+ start:225 stop:464 length:240 start_codon:yes stop_codon:yes gene_type:complete